MKVFIIPSSQLRIEDWSPYAYVETDYSTITQEDFEQTVREYMIFQMTEQLRQAAKEKA